MKIRRILLCEDSLEGILTAVYEAYASRYGLHDICVELIDERQRQTVLFSEYKVIETNIEYAAGVAKAIRKKISEEAFWTVYNAACAQDSAKANAIYRFIVYGLYYGSKVMEALSEPDIRLVLQLSRKVGRECEHLYGFLRFEPVQVSGHSILFARIRPKHNQLQNMGRHFSNRYPKESFIICDTGRKLACLHLPAEGCRFFKYDDETFGEFKAGIQAEDEYQKLWQSFFNTVMISQRSNPKCQMSMMPKRYWEYMAEMKGGKVSK